MRDNQTIRILQQGVSSTSKSYCQIPIQLAPGVQGHKQKYTVGVLAIRGAEAARQELQATFEDYLTKSAGQIFDPPIQFEMKPLRFGSLFRDVERQLVDFIYVNPFSFSCIESEYVAMSLASQVSRREQENITFPWTKFGGVIATLAGREDVQSINDIRGKIVAAVSLYSLGSGQTQFQQMLSRGMNYLQDPKQLVFTSDHGKIIQGLADGSFDVGFLGVDQFGRYVDEQGKSLNISSFKILDPMEGLETDGDAFPFQSLTQPYFEWNVASLTHIHPEVSRQVQSALLNLKAYANVGKVLDDCVVDHNETFCFENDLSELYTDPLMCSATHEIVAAAYQAQSDGDYAGWTTTLSYMPLRSMQQETGFIRYVPDRNRWSCIRSAELYDAIVCPEGYFRKSREDVDRGCASAGLECQEGFQCICRPCEAPNELVCVDSVRMGDRCVNLAVFLSAIVIPIILFVGIVVALFLNNKTKMADALWIVKPSELQFEDPPIVVGRGSFGLVLLGEFRGTEVAVKRVIPPGPYDSDYSVIFEVDDAQTSTTTSAATGAINDTELGLRSIHPGMTSVAPNVHGLHDLRKQMSSRAKKKTQTRFTVFKQRFQRDEKARRFEQLKRDFVQEIRQLARMRHPCITTIMGAVMPSCRDEPMLVMEYMRHGSLYDVLHDHSITLQLEQKLAILQDVAQGLRYLHTASPKVIHGALKSSNILIDGNFCAKVADFGFSGKVRTDAVGTVGTPFWMSPEILSGHGLNSTASDVYAYGMLVYEIHSGKTPYEGEGDYEEIVHQICDARIRKRPAVPTNCPPKLAKIMTDCLEHDPQRRPTAEQLDLALKVELTVKQRTSRLEALNRELEEANCKIAEASKMQLQHFASMSHEIRTPLNCIIGLSTLLEETDINAMQRESIEMIVSSGKLLRQIVDDVLDYSKLESGNDQLLAQKINLQETLNAVIHLVQTNLLTVEKKLNIRTQFDPLLPGSIQSDGRRIQQILYNLLGNAIKFSKEDGTIDLGVHWKNDQKSMIRITVKDYGKGIQACDFESIYEAFRQTETGLSNATRGTGLGLSITKKLVIALGGEISVNSEYGSWTQFTVDLPSGVKTPAVKPSELASRLSHCRVVAILEEQDTATRTHVQHVLEYFEVPMVVYHSMQELDDVMRSEDYEGRSTAHVCLCHEQLCEIPLYESLVKDFPICLATFGPRFAIEKYTKKHWRSIVDVFPSVLMDTLGDLAQELISDPYHEKDAFSGFQTSNIEFSGLSVLIADDNVVNQKVLERMLHRLGVVDTAVAVNGEMAVDMEAKRSFDLILMDMQMPVLDGIEATRQINHRDTTQEKHGHPLAKIIFFTAHVGETIRQTCLENGAIGYLPKPTTIDGLRQALRNAAGCGSMFAPAYQETLPTSGGLSGSSCDSRTSFPSVFNTYFPHDLHPTEVDSSMRDGNSKRSSRLDLPSTSASY